MGVDLEILDVQQGRDLDSTYDPHTFAEQLRELENCHEDSLGCFLLVFNHFLFFFINVKK